MILNKVDLKFFIEQDKLMNGRVCLSTTEKIKFFFVPDEKIKFLRYLRKTEYYHNCSKSNVSIRLNRLILYYFYRIKLHKLGIRLGYSIPINVVDSGLSLPHVGTIVISPKAHIGKNCRLHVGVNIGASGGNDEAPLIGDNVYIGPGAILFGDIKIANNVTIGANATVNKSCEKQNVVFAGTPAKIVKENYPSWVVFNKICDAGVSTLD